MKTEKRIFAAFILNLSFAVFEFVGGLMCGSFAIASDAVHDLGDAAAIGASYFLERKAGRPPDEKYTIGYGRFSLLGSFITSMLLIFGSIGVMFGAIRRIFEPTEINYGGMTVFALIGFAVNLAAVLFTRGGDGMSLNLRAVNLHMLEDVLGWAVVLVGALVMRFTELSVIDPLMSVTLSVFIFIHAAEHLRETADVFLGKTPNELDVGELKDRLYEVEGVIEVGEVRIVNLDGSRLFAAVRIVTDSGTDDTKEAVRGVLRDFGVCEAVIETTDSAEL